MFKKWRVLIFSIICPQSGHLIGLSLIKFSWCSRHLWCRTWPHKDTNGDRLNVDFLVERGAKQKAQTIWDSSFSFVKSSESELRWTHSLQRRQLGRIDDIFFLQFWKIPFEFDLLIYFLHRLWGRVEILLYIIHTHIKSMLKYIIHVIFAKLRPNLSSSWAWG